jgi:hypothetical protein
VLATKNQLPCLKYGALEFQAADWQSLLAQPDSLFTGPGVEVLKDSPSSQVIRRTITVGPHELRVVIKRARRKWAWKSALNCLRRSRPVERYIYTHGHEVGHFWCAHPEATVTMKRQALALHALHDEYLASGRSGRDWERFITRAQMLL